MSSPNTRSDAATARWMLVMLSLCWGLSWPAMKIALREVDPFALRTICFAMGLAALTAVIRIQGRSLVIPPGRNRLHVAVAGFFIVVVFSLAASFAQLLATTSRVIIINYSMPVWASLLAWLLLGERLSARSLLSLALCIAGLVVLVGPVWEEPRAGLALAFLCALTWAAGTLYMKWASPKGDLLAIAFWQVVLGLTVSGVGHLVIAGPPQFVTLHWQTVAAMAFTGVFGMGLAYVLWYGIVERLSTATASLGSLANPVVGVIGTVVLTGERPTGTDVIGFALIFAAAVCVLIPNRSSDPPPRASNNSA